ncbi:MAG: hypothetical protein GC172_06350 [Phycisphaera sp.]|jgi:hypothetical protein|nr:hypothetical protein [Phycisphaera sp.]
MSLFDPIIDLLGECWNGFNRMHRGGLGESPRGLADYRRNRWIVGGALVLLGIISIAVWLISRP